MKGKYSAIEENVLISSQLYQFDRYAVNNLTLIETIGNLLPGVLLINDVAKMENIYMNDTGCAILGRSRKEINELGVKYFSSDNFCEQEMSWVAKYFGAFAQRQDHHEVTGFYQKVRTSNKHEWKQFYMSGKILKECPGHFIYMGFETNQINKSIHKINDQLNISPIGPVTFQRFSSLSKREKEILKLIANGCSNKQVSEYLCISLFTVQTHRKNINRKLETKTLRDLIRISDLFNL